jgi:ATP-binding cassette subfamily F protein 3
MLLAQFSNVSKSFSGDTILSGVSWQIAHDLKCGLVGENGAGKTTLFKLLTKQLEPDTGDVVVKKAVHIGLIEQEMSSPPGATLRSEAMRALSHLEETERELNELSQELSTLDDGHDPDALADLLERYSHLHEKYEREGGFDTGHRLAMVLDGLSFTTADLDRPLAEFSGGQKTRAALARVLLRTPDLLLLDEPTNHLDIHAIEWLENFLADYEGAYIVISHDRYFLDRLAKEIVEVHQGALRQWKGNYSKFLEAREARLELEWKAYEEQESLIERTEDFIRRNLAGQKTKQAQSRRKQLEKIDRLPRPAGRSKVMNLVLPEPERSGRIVLDVKDVEKSYGVRKVLEPLTFRLQRGDKMGVIGPNGAGKTTLLRLILGQDAWDHGDIRLGAGVQIGYFEQEQKQLRGPHSVLDEAWKVTPLVTENEIRTFLGGFLFSGDDVFKPLNALSGGEKSRLALALIVRSRANFLVLDEPTNHLDIPSRAVFEEAIASFEGTVLAVSHDRWFLDRVANQILELHEGRGRLWLGNWSDYRRRRDEAASPAAAPKPVPAAPSPPVPATSPQARARSEARADRKERDRRRKEVEQLEVRIAALEAEKAAAEARLESPDATGDHTMLRELGRRHQDISRELGELIARWETLQAGEVGHA